jgi:hypothetical protein
MTISKNAADLMAVQGNVEHSIRSDPFPHVLMTSVLKTAVAQNCLSLLANVLWDNREGSFYRFMVPARDCVNEHIFRLIEPHRFQTLLEKSLRCELEVPQRIEIHRYELSCGIGPHTDALCQEVRLVMSLNAHWNPDQGGIWILACESDLKTPRIFLPPMNNTAFAFSTGTTSFHALSTCGEGMIYSIIARFPRRLSNI